MKTIHMGLSIRKHRIAAGYSQDGLAILTGMTRSYISKVENERCTPDLRTLIRFAIALEVDPCRIIRIALDTVSLETPTEAVKAPPIVQ